MAAPGALQPGKAPQRALPEYRGSGTNHHSAALFGDGKAEGSGKGKNTKCES